MAVMTISDNRPLAQQVAIVSGGGGPIDADGVEGIGSAIAVALAAAGTAVLVIDRDETAGQTTVDRITDAGGHAALLVADIADPDTGERAVQAAIDRFGDVDILVNNAAVTSRLAAHAMTAEEWTRVIGVNLTGTMFLAAAALRHFMARGGGSVVNIASAAGMRSFGNPAYAASKAGMIGLTVDLAGSYGPHNIRVNAVVPGTVETPMVRSLVDPAQREARLSLTALRREGYARDVAAAVVYLCGPDARWITGVTLPVDGGMLTLPPRIG
jgi:NAD(P)-dependent dehydrogenase (short-subunit alcohol dehydrogenase family)